MADGRSVRTKGHQSSFTQETLDPAQLHAQKHVEPTCRRLGGCCVLALQSCHWKEHAVHSRLRAASHIPRPDHALRHEPIPRQPPRSRCSGLISIRLRCSLHDLRSRRLRLVSYFSVRR